ncbi:hypothetical protein CR513_52730, partial [Mucuna pruriens]
SITNFDDGTLTPISTVFSLVIKQEGQLNGNVLTNPKALLNSTNEEGLGHVCSLFPYVKLESNKACQFCAALKLFHILYMIHIDVWRPLAISSLHGHQYFLTIVDDFSLHT